MGVKLSETAVLGPVAGPHQRHWPGLPDPGLRPASPQLPPGQNTVSSFRFQFRPTSSQVSLLSSSHRTVSPSLCALVLAVKSVVLGEEALPGRGPGAKRVTSGSGSAPANHLCGPPSVKTLSKPQFTPLCLLSFLSSDNL